MTTPGGDLQAAVIALALALGEAEDRGWTAPRLRERLIAPVLEAPSRELLNDVLLCGYALLVGVDPGLSELAGIWTAPAFDRTVRWMTALVRDLGHG